MAAPPHACPALFRASAAAEAVMARGLRYGPLGPHAVHICVDMQILFGPGFPWAIPWLERILPNVTALSARNPGRSLFTRFLPPATPREARGAWARYYRKWEEVTLAQIGPEAVALLPALAPYAAPERIIDKSVYSPWLTPSLEQALARAQADTVFLTGGETDICVLATALGAIDRGFRVILVEDALCSTFDRSHDQMLELYSRRFDTQLEVTDTQTLLKEWPG